VCGFNFRNRFCFHEQPEDASGAAVEPFKTKIPMSADDDNNAGSEEGGGVVGGLQQPAEQAKQNKPSARHRKDADDGGKPGGTVVVVEPRGETVRLVGEPLASHGPYAFYAAFRYRHRDNAARQKKRHRWKTPCSGETCCGDDSCSGSDDGGGGGCEWSVVRMNHFYAVCPWYSKRNSCAGDQGQLCRGRKKSPAARAAGKERRQNQHQQQSVCIGELELLWRDDSVVTMAAKRACGDKSCSGAAANGGGSAVTTGSSSNSLQAPSSDEEAAAAAAAAATGAAAAAAAAAAASSSSSSSSSSHTRSRRGRHRVHRHEAVQVRGRRSNDQLQEEPADRRPLPIEIQNQTADHHRDHRRPGLPVGLQRGVQVRAGHRQQAQVQVHEHDGARAKTQAAVAPVHQHGQRRRGQARGPQTAQGVRAAGRHQRGGVREERHDEAGPVHGGVVVRAASGRRRLRRRAAAEIDERRTAAAGRREDVQKNIRNENAERRSDR